MVCDIVSMIASHFHIGHICFRQYTYLLAAKYMIQLDHDNLFGQV